MATEELKLKVSADVAGAVNGMKQVNNELAKTGPAAAKTGKDFTGLSRVVQDLPFGFVAISNNLTQLIPAAGAAGLAFSAIVAGLTFAQTGLANWTRGLSGSKSGINDNEDALIRFSQDIKNATDDVDDFTAALDQINKIGKLRLDIDFGKGLGTDLLNLQGISIGNAQLLDKLNETEGIVQKKTSDLREAFLELLEPEELTAFDKGVLKISKLTEQQRDAFDRMSNAEKNLTDVQKDVLKTRNQQNVIYAQIEQQKIDITEDSRKKQEESNRKALADLKRRLEEEAKLRLAHIKSLTESFVGRDKPIPIFYQLQLAAVRAKNDPSEGLSQQLTKELLPKTIPLRVNVAPKVVLAAPIELTELQSSLEAAVSQVAVEAFSTIGEGIAAAITGGDISAAFGSLFQTIGGAIQALGKQMIEFSAIVQALKAAIRGLDPTGGLASGIALVALGGVIKNFKPQGFKHGGVIPAGFPNDSFYARLTSGERVLTPAQNKAWEKQDFGPLKMSAPQVIIPTLRIGYNEIEVMFNRASKHGRLTS